MLTDLDSETLYDVIQNVGNYVLTGEKCDCDNTLSRIVCNQLISVIDRKGEKSYNSSKNLPDRKKKEEHPSEPHVSTYTHREDGIKESQDVVEQPQVHMDDDSSSEAQAETSEERDFISGLKEIYRNDRNKAERVLNDACQKNGYDFFKILAEVKTA